MFIPLSFVRRALPLALLATLLPVLAGCGTKVENARKVQDTLQEALRHAQVDPDDKQARQWADRAVAIAPNDPVTYFGDPSANASLSPLSVPPLSLDLIFGGAGVEDDAALADYMAQAVQKFPDDERGYQELIDADARLGRDADRQKTARALVALLTRKLNHPAPTDIETLDLALAQAYWDSGDAVNGALKGQAAVGAYPASPSPPNNLAYAYAVANTHLPEALTLAQKAIALARSKNLSDEEIAQYQDTLGWVQLPAGAFFGRRGESPAGGERSAAPARNPLPPGGGLRRRGQDRRRPRRVRPRPPARAGLRRRPGGPRQTA